MTTKEQEIAYLVDRRTFGEDYAIEMQKLRKKMLNISIKQDKLIEKHMQIRFAETLNSLGTGATTEQKKDE